MSVELNPSFGVIPPNLDHTCLRETLLQEIQQASQEKIKEIRERMNQAGLSFDGTLLKAIADRQDALLNQTTEVITRLKGNVSTFMLDENGNYQEISDLDLSEKVRGQIPENTYQSVNVSTIAKYTFVGGEKKARKIELARREWGFIRIPVANSVAAFCSSLAVKNSIYREPINQNLLMGGLLASSQMDDQKKGEFETQVIAAYWSGKKIEIIVPFDFSEDGVVKMESSSKLLSFSIDGGKWLRSLFRKRQTSIYNGFSNN